MALNADQKAMLRLLAQREQGYGDIASLMGISVEEVRVRVGEALDELDAPEAAEAVAPPPPPEPKPAPAPAARREPAEAEPPRPRARRAAPAAPRPRPRLRLPSDPRARLGIAGGALLLVVLVLIVALSGGDGDSSGAATENGNAAVGAVDDPNVTQAVLAPVDGGDASGRAVFGRIDRTAVLQVDADGLEPSPAGQSYAVWLYRSPQVVLRIGAVRVTDSGSIAAQFPLPTQLLAYIAGGAFNQIDISLTSNAAYREEVAAARRERRLPALTGESVLRGRITGRLIRAGRAAAR